LPNGKWLLAQKTLCKKHKDKIDKIAVDFLQEAVTFIVSATCMPNLVDGKVLNFYPGM